MPIIRVNLLPPEKRRRERTPLSRFVALIVGTAVNAAIVAFMVKIFLDTNSLNRQKGDVEARMITTQKKVEPPDKKSEGYEATKKTIEKIGARKKAIDDLKKEKILVWSEVIDSVCDVVAANQWVWLTGVDMAEGAKGKSGTTQLDLFVTLSCSSTASEEDCKLDKVGEVMTKFKKDIWDKYKLGPGSVPPRPFPFDYADENFPINRKDDDRYRETVLLTYSATVGRRMGAPAKGLPVKR